MSAGGEAPRAPGVPDQVELEPAAALEGTASVPGDKSISHRALILAALADGTSSLRGLADGEDVARTADLVAAIGASVERDGTTRATVRGGRAGLSAADAAHDCGNSGTTMRLACGLLSTVPGVHVLDGDASLRRRPMDRVAVPLRRMGAVLDGRGDGVLPPLTVTGGALRAIRYELPVASAQVKSAVLLAGLASDGPTTVIEPVRTRTHTETMLARAGARIEVTQRPDGRHTTLWPSQLQPVDWDVPGDPSQAAFLLVAAVLAAGGNVEVRNVDVSPERLGFVAVLERMGAHVVTRVGRHETGDLLAAPSALSSTTVEAAELPSLDEVPILAVAAAAATGTTTFSDAGELRVKESDRLVATADLVVALGASARCDGDDLVVTGLGDASRFSRFCFDAAGDHRMAMAAAVAAVCGRGGTVQGFGGVATSFPGFLAALASLR